MLKRITALSAAILLAAPLPAASPRETLVAAAFLARDKPTALAEVRQAKNDSEATLAATPNDRDAQLVRAMATAYQAKLERVRGDAVAAGRMFAALAAADPRDPEAQAAVGAWNIDAVSQLGGLLAGTLLGAKKQAGLAAMDRAVALGGGRAMFPGLAALLRRGCRRPRARRGRRARHDADRARPDHAARGERGARAAARRRHARRRRAGQAAAPVRPPAEVMPAAAASRPGERRALTKGRQLIKRGGVRMVR